MNKTKAQLDSFTKQLKNNIMILKIINIRQPITRENIEQLADKLLSPRDIKRSLRQLKTSGLISEIDSKFFTLLQGRYLTQATGLRKRQDIDRMLYLSEEIRRVKD